MCLSGQLTKATGGDADILLVIRNWPIAMILPLLIQTIASRMSLCGQGVVIQWQVGLEWICVSGRLTEVMMMMTLRVCWVLAAGSITAILHELFISGLLQSKL